MDSEMEGFKLESPPSPPTSYLSMESEEDQPVGDDKEHDFTPLIVDLERAASPETKRSKSECCSVQPREGAFFPGHGVNLERAASPETKQSECYSVQPREGAFFPEQGPEATHQSVSSSENMMLELERMIPEKEKNLCPMGIPFIFKSILKTLQELKKTELSQFKKLMRRTYPQYFENQMEDFDVLDVVDMIMERCGKVIAIKVTVHILKCMKMNDLATSLAVETRRIMLQHELKERLKMKYETIFEGIAKHGCHCYLSRIHAHVHMTEGGNGEVNDEHEVRQSEIASGRQSTPEVALKPSDLFEPSFVSERRIRTVMTRGIAGIGLTVAVQKFIVDWIEEKANQDIHFVFPIPFGEQTCVKMQEQSLIDYLTIFHPEIGTMDFIDSPDCKVLFIFDALEEYRHTLNFQKNGIWTDPKAPTSVDMLVTNLIKGNLLPNCLLWITTRTAASRLIPADYVNLLTQVHGFTDLQKEQYFKKKSCDENQARKIISRVKTSRTLHIMSHIPTFSWMLATVFAEQNFADDQEESPVTMTELFTHYSLLQLNMMHSKYFRDNADTPVRDRDFLMKLGKLGFQLLEKGHKEFSLKNLKDCNLDVEEAIVHSGLCTEVFSLHTESQPRVFCFIHLSIQEYLAAFYVYMSFRVKHKSLLDQTRVFPPTKLFKGATLLDLLTSAVDKSLRSQNGHLDLFLRFLLGLSVDSIQRLFRTFIPLPESSTHCIEETARYIRKKIEENASPDRCQNLHHCLTELKG